MTRCIMLLFLFVNFGCFRQGSDLSSNPKTDGVDTCSAPIDQLGVDCLVEIMQRLPDHEIIRNLRLLSRNNPKLKNALFGIAVNRVPKWRISQIKQEIIKTGSSGSEQSRDPLDQDRFEDDVIRNYVEFVKSLSYKPSSLLGETSSQERDFGQPLVTLKGARKVINNDSVLFISNHVAVYQASDFKIVGIDTINGAEIFSYDTGEKLAKAFAPIGEGKFLSAHAGVVFLWSLDPKVGSQKPLARWEHPTLSDHGSSIELIVMSPNIFVATTWNSLSVFTLSSPEPTHVIKRDGIKNRLQKMTADELFIKPEQKDVEANFWTPEFLNVNTGKIAKRAAIAIENGKALQFLAVSESKIILYNREVMKSHKVFVYEKNHHKLVQLGKNYSDLRFGPELIYLSSSSCYGDVYDIRTGELITSVEEKFMPFYKIGDDYFISKPYGGRMYVYSWRKKLARIGSINDLGGVKYPTATYYLESVSDGGEIFLQNNNRELTIVNLWVNVAKKLANPVKAQ